MSPAVPTCQLNSALLPPKPVCASLNLLSSLKGRPKAISVSRAPDTRSYLGTQARACLDSREKGLLRVLSGVIRHYRVTVRWHFCRRLFPPLYCSFRQGWARGTSEYLGASPSLAAAAQAGSLILCPAGLAPGSPLPAEQCGRQPTQRQLQFCVFQERLCRFKVILHFFSKKAFAGKVKKKKKRKGGVWQECGWGSLFS